MKRPKRAIPMEKKFTDSMFSVVCPHCRVTLIGGVGQSIDRLFCRNCGEIIMLDWQALKAVKEQSIK